MLCRLRGEILGFCRIPDSRRGKRELSGEGRGSESRINGVHGPDMGTEPSVRTAKDSIGGRDEEKTLSNR